MQLGSETLSNVEILRYWTVRRVWWNDQPETLWILSLWLSESACAWCAVVWYCSTQAHCRYMSLDSIYLLLCSWRLQLKLSMGYHNGWWTIIRHVSTTAQHDAPIFTCLRDMCYGALFVTGKQPYCCGSFSDICVLRLLESQIVRRSAKFYLWIFASLHCNALLLVNSS